MATKQQKHGYAPRSAAYTNDEQSVATANCVCGFATRSTRAYPGEDVLRKARRNVDTHVSAQKRKAARATASS